MSLEKAIKYGKEKRKEYGTKGDFAKRVSGSCRNHGSCEWCKGNRLYNSKKKLEKSKEDDRTRL